MNTFPLIFGRSLFVCVALLSLICFCAHQVFAQAPDFQQILTEVDTLEQESFELNQQVGALLAQESVDTQGATNLQNQLEELQDRMLQKMQMLLGAQDGLQAQIGSVPPELSAAIDTLDGAYARTDNDSRRITQVLEDSGGVADVDTLDRVNSSTRSVLDDCIFSAETAERIAEWGLSVLIEHGYNYLDLRISTESFMHSEIASYICRGADSADIDVYPQSLFAPEPRIDLGPCLDEIDGFSDEINCDYLCPVNDGADDYYSVGLVCIDPFIQEQRGLRVLNDQVGHAILVVKDVDRFSEENSAYYPEGCELDLADFLSAMHKGFDWYGPDWSSNLIPSPGSVLYTQLAGYVCAGMPVDRIEIKQGDIASNQEYALQRCGTEEAVYYPSAQNVCDHTCFVDSTWTSGEVCLLDNQARDAKASFVVVKTPKNARTCYSTEDECLRVQEPYLQSGLITNTDHFCQRKDSGGGRASLGPRYCFYYQAKITPDEDELSEVGTGLVNCFAPTSTRNLEATERYCIQEMTWKYGDLYPDEQIRCELVSIEERAPGGPRSVQKITVEKWCMADAGWTGRTQAQADQYKKDRQTEEAEKSRIQSINAMQFGGGAGGLVPECDETIDVELADGTTAKQKVGCGWYDLVELVNRIITFIVQAAAVILVVACMVAGWGLITAQGNAGALNEAKKRLTDAVIGLVIVLTAWAAVNTVMGLFLNDDIFSEEDGTNELNLLNEIER